MIALPSEKGASTRLIDVRSPGGPLPTSPFKLNNSLADHPLFETDRIKRLLCAVPRKYVEIRAVQSVDTNDGSYKQGALLTDVDPVDTFERLEERPRWMLIHESWVYDKDYEQLLRDYLKCLTDELAELRPGISNIGCWMFLSSGKSVVHFHADPDQSFLNQVRGSKTVTVYPTAVLPEETVEKLVFTQRQGQEYKQDYEKKAFQPIHLAPGESVFLPLYAPHRVTNDESICVSWNVGFHTNKSNRRKTVHLVNWELRKLGVTPSPYNRILLVDSLKVQMYLGIRIRDKIRHIIRTIKSKLGYPSESDW